MNALFSIFAALEAPQIFGPMADGDPAWYQGTPAAVAAAGVGLVAMATLAVVVTRTRAKKRAALAALPQNVAKRKLAELAGRSADRDFLLALAALLREALSASAGKDFRSASAAAIEAALAATAAPHRSEKAVALLARCERALFSGTGAGEAEELIAAAREALAALFATEDKPKGTSA